MRVFFPNATIRYPPVNGPDIHRFQIIKNLIALGCEFTTLQPDQNPLVQVVARDIASVYRALRNTDVVYCRPGERPDSVTRLTLPPFRWLLPSTLPIVWEQNRALTISLSAKNPRTAKQIEDDLKVFRRAAKRVDAAIGVTEQVSHELRTLLHLEDVTTLQNASDPEMFRPDLPPPASIGVSNGALRVIWMGSHANAVHNWQLVRDLAYLVQRNGSPIEIHVLGNTRELFPISELTSLKHHGPISYLELPPYLAAMDIGLTVYHGRTDGQSPLKLFDYMASGCVPICTPGEPMEAVLLSESAGLVQEWTAESLHAELLSLHQNRDGLERMALKARKLVETRHNWRRVAEDVLEILNRVIIKRRR